MGDVVAGVIFCLVWLPWLATLLEVKSETYKFNKRTHQLKNLRNSLLRFKELDLSLMEIIQMEATEHQDYELPNRNYLTVRLLLANGKEIELLPSTYFPDGNQEKEEAIAKEISEFLNIPYQKQSLELSPPRKGILNK